MIDRQERLRELSDQLVKTRTLCARFWHLDTIDGRTESGNAAGDLMEEINKTLAALGREMREVNASKKAL